MNSGSEPPENLLPSRSNRSIDPQVLPSLETTKFPMRIEPECVRQLNAQLKGLQFFARLGTFKRSVSQAGDEETFVYIEVFRENSSSKRFLIDIQEFALVGFEQKLIDELMNVSHAFLTKFKSGIFLYLIYKTEPDTIYKVLVRERVEHAAFKQIKFISVKAICGFSYIMNSEFQTTHIQEIQKELTELLDLELEELQLSEAAPNAEEDELQNKLDLSAISDDDKHIVFTIISDNSDFKADPENLICIQASLREVFQNFKFEAGNVRMLTWEIIDKLVKEKKLGKLLRAIRRHMDLEENIRRDLDQIFEKYSCLD